MKIRQVKHRSKTFLRLALFRCMAPILCLVSVVEAVELVAVNECEEVKGVTLDVRLAINEVEDCIIGSNFDRGLEVSRKCLREIGEKKLDDIGKLQMKRLGELELLCFFLQEKMLFRRQLKLESFDVKEISRGLDSVTFVSDQHVRQYKMGDSFNGAKIARISTGGITLEFTYARLRYLINIPAQPLRGNVSR